MEKQHPQLPHFAWSRYIDSDHNLLIADVKMKLQCPKKGNKTPKYDLDSLRKPDIQQKYSIEISNRFQLLEDTERTPNELWQEVKDTIHETASKILGKPQTKPKKPWISPETLTLIDKKRLLRQQRRTSAKADASYKAAKHEVQNSIRKDRNNWLEDQCTHLEDLYERNNSRDFFKVVNKLTKKSAPKTGNVKNKAGRLLTETEDIKSRWKEFTEDLYHAVDQSAHPVIPFTPDMLEPDILRAEVIYAMHKLPNNKAAGVDNIPAELLKASGVAGIDKLWDICNRIWHTGQWPEDWTSSVFITIPKKGDLTVCDNYRTIALISHASKILLSIILKRMEEKLNVEIPEEQAGFRKGRGTSDQIFNLQMLLQKKVAANTPIYIAFIDYRKAFDSVSHQKMSRTLLEMGFPSHIAAIVQALYISQKAAVQVDGDLTNWFTVGKGVRQGCILSPALFNIYSEMIMRIALEDSQLGASIGGRCVSNLRYADDVALIAEDEPTLQELLQNINLASQQYNLDMNIKKTKIMTCAKSDINADIHLNGETVEQVQDFTYLGASFNSQLDASREIKKRLAIARTKYTAIQSSLKMKSLSIKTKTRLLHSLVFPIALYGCEAWTIKKTDAQRINSFEMWCYRRILQVSWTDRRTNQSILAEILPKERFIVSVRRRKLCYFGHVARGSAGELGTTILEGKVEGKRSRGRPKATWLDNIKDWTGLSLHAAVQRAKDRLSWRYTVKLAATHPQSEEGTG